jgi:hypothetical protein
MATADVQTNLQLDLFDLLQTGAAGACSRLAAYCRADGPHSCELKGKFYGAVADVERVTIEALAKASGAFVVQDGHLRIAEAPIPRLLNVVVRDLNKRLAEGDPSLEQDEVPRILERVFVQYVLHEVRHRTQGLANLSDVQTLRAIAGAGAMLDYDVQADRDAALASAALYASDESRAAFLAAFREALFFSTQYFFEVFPIPAERPDKIARAMAILFMAARLAKRDLGQPTVEDDSLPLDATLYVSLSAPTKSMAIHRGEPTRELLGFANDADGVGTLMEQICNGDMGGALSTSIKIADKLQLIA